MLTYNQKDFIGQAIEGVLMQETDFSFELVIGEDFSTDGTREICLDFASKYPKKIKLILNEMNLGLIKNYIQTYKQCSGEYVAICDGDDYWIDSQKLQDQVNFLKKNPSYRLVFTNTYSLYPSGVKQLLEFTNLPETTAFKDLIFDNYIPSVTSMFLNEKLPESMQSWLTHFPFGDWPTYLYILRNGGKIGYLSKPTAVYRREFGTSTALRLKRSKMGEINLAILECMRRDIYFRKKRVLITKAIYKYKKGLMASYNKDGKFLKSLKLFLELFPQPGKRYLVKNYFYSLKRSLQLLS